MTQVPLHDYLSKMRGQLREGQYADLMALGQYVLRYYPKHIETYRLLAEASLETNDLIAAADLFQRVRSADPENIIALVGLSIVHEQRGELEEAIWHLERAFEIQPANAELRKELLRLYAEHEGTPRDRLKLTPGGLARLYARQGLFSQAIQEFRGLLRRDPARTDIQAALAETLYRTGRKQEAAEVAQALLEKLPYCLKANLVLGALWSENGVPEAEALLQRAQALDPEHTVARGLVPDHWEDAPPPMLPAVGGETATAAPPVTPSERKSEEGAGRELSLLESLSPAAAPPAKAEAPSAPQPEIERGIEAEPPVMVEAPAAVPPELQPALGAVEQAAAQPQPGEPIEQELESVTPTVEPAKEQPAAAPPVQATEEEPAPPLSPTGLPPGSQIVGEPKPARRIQPSLPQIGPTIPGALEKLPAWLRGAAAPVAQDTAPTPSAGAAESVSVGALGLSQLEKNRPVQEASVRITRAPQRAESQAADLPEWLTRARQAARAGDLEENVAASSEVEEKPAWLTEADTETPPKEGPTVSPEWLRADSSGAASDQAGAEAGGALPAWLGASETGGETETPPSNALLPDWLSGPKQGAEPAAEESGTPAPESLQPPEPQAPPETPLPEAPAPDWLAPQATAVATPEVETDETIPEWLREISEAREPEPVAASPVQSHLAEQVRAEPAAPDAHMIEPPAEISAAPTVAEPVEPEPSVPLPETAVTAQVEEKSEAEPDALLAQARDLWTSGNQTGAIELYEKALQKGPGLTSEVIADFEQFVQAPDAPMPAHRLLGDAYSMVGRFKEALDQYRIVLGK